MERGLPQVAVVEPATSNDGGLRSRADELATATRSWQRQRRGRCRALALGDADVGARRRGAAPPGADGVLHRGAGCTGRRRPGASTRRSGSTRSAAWSAYASTTPPARCGSSDSPRGGAIRWRSPASARPLECGDGELPAELQSVTRVRLAGGKPVESERYMPPTGSCTRERYRHEGGRLARVEEDSCDDGGGLATVVKEIVYGDDGRVAGIDALGPDGRQAVWRTHRAAAPGAEGGSAPRRRPATSPSVRVGSGAPPRAARRSSRQRWRPSDRSLRLW